MYVYSYTIKLPPHLRMIIKNFSFKKSSCRSMVKECTPNNGKLPQEGLPRNGVVRITDHSDMTSEISVDVQKHIKQIKENNCVRKSKYMYFIIINLNSVLIKLADLENGARFI